MVAELPDPLVPADVDLRDYDYIPLYGDKLFNSDTWALCDSDEKVAALRLWWKSWHEEPAGSLPNNDRLLAERAGYGVAVKAFLGVKANAMRGWIPCSDGRLYHPVVASIALDVWGKKRRKRIENAADRERKKRKRDAMSGRTTTSVPPDSDEIPPDAGPDKPTNPPDVQSENALKGREVEGKGEPPPTAPPHHSNGADVDARGARGTRLPEDWRPCAELRDFARQLGLDPDEAAAEFLDFWRSVPGSKGRKLDWDGTFRNRCRELSARQGNRGARPSGGRPGTGGILAALGSFSLPGEVE